MQMKAVQKFKNTIAHNRPPGLDGILGKGTQMVQPPLSMEKSEKPPLYHKTRSLDTDNRRPIEQVLVAGGVHRDVDLDDHNKSVTERPDTAIAHSPKTPPKRTSTQESDEKDSSSPISPQRHLNAHPQDHRPSHAATAPTPVSHGKGQAHDPLSDHLYLGLGSGGSSGPPSPPAVSESPPAADTNIYEIAYHNEIERIRSMQGRSTTLFLTRRVEDREDYQKDDGLIKGDRSHGAKPKTGFAKLFDQARMKAAKGDESDEKQQEGGGNAQAETST